MPGPMLTRRSALLVQMMSSYGVLPSFDGSTDALLMSNPQYTADIAQLKRSVIQPSLSQLKSMAGRKLGKITFSAEPNLNGKASTGIAGNAPLLGRLLRGSGMAQTAKSATWVTGVMPLSPEAQAAATVASSYTGSYAGDPIAYTIGCTTGGASGTAKLSVTPHDTTLDTAQSNITATNGTPIALGSNGASVTFSSIGTLVAGMQWVVVLYPPGLMYSPISTGFESLGLAFYVDGSVHQLSDAYGTFSMKAQAGQLVSFDFDFTGRYVDYADQAFPAVTYTGGKPPVFQSAGVSLDGYNPIVDSFTIDINNTISERMSANAADGLYGLMITGRDPKGGLDPEATAQATHDFWQAYATADVAPLFAKTGTLTGSKLFVAAPGAQYAGLVYKDRNGVRAHDVAIELKQTFGDDELSIYLY